MQDALDELKEKIEPPPDYVFIGNMAFYELRVIEFQRTKLLLKLTTIPRKHETLLVDKKLKSFEEQWDITQSDSTTDFDYIIGILRGVAPQRIRLEIQKMFFEVE